MAVFYISLRLFNEDSTSKDFGMKVVELNEHFKIVGENEVSNLLVKALQRVAGSS